MYNSDKNILQLIEDLKKLGLIKFDSQFCDSIGLKKQNLNPIKKGLAHFTGFHIEQICLVYSVNANYIFGISDKIFTTIKAQKSAQTS
jgi:hypothetical protein